jgi:membrane fusion protein, multidrug efflux system
MNSVAAGPSIGIGEPLPDSRSTAAGPAAAVASPAASSPLADSRSAGAGRPSAGTSMSDAGVADSGVPPPVRSDPAFAGSPAAGSGAAVANVSDAGVGDGAVPRPLNLPSRKTLLVPGAALIVALAAAVFGYHWWTVGRFIESTDDAYVGGDITVIAPKVSGFISRVAVTDNQQVRAGDILVELDNRDYVAARARAVAAVAAQEAAITNLTATRHLQEAVIAQAQAGINAADAEIERSQEDQVRYRRLEKLSAVSTQESQKADADYKNAIAAGAKARAALAAAQRQLDVIDSQSQQAAAALAQAKADREVADLNLSYTELRAPMDGTVGNRSARAGAYATIGAQMMSLVPARGLWVDANFKESQLAHMRASQPVTVEADVLPGRVFHGHVASLAPATGAVFSVLPAENATGNFTKIVQRVPVRVILDGDASQLGQLRPGLSVIAAVDMHPPADMRTANQPAPTTTRAPSPPATNEIVPAAAASHPIAMTSNAPAPSGSHPTALATNAPAAGAPRSAATTISAPAAGTLRSTAATINAPAAGTLTNARAATVAAN